MPNPSSSFTVVHPPKLSHADIRDYLSLAMEGGIGADMQQQVARHLADCASCRAFDQTLRATVGAVRELPRQPTPADLRRRLLGLANA